MRLVLTYRRYGALRLVSVEQGFDPRDFSLVGFGGAGPLHANSLGKLIGSFPVIIPPSPGVLCALGDAKTILRHELGKTFVRVTSSLDPSELFAAFKGLLERVKKIMDEEQGVPSEKQVGLLAYRARSPARHTYSTSLVLD